MKHKEKIRERAAAVIVRNNQILLMYREKNGEQYYVFPGGGIETWETPRTAVIREIKEEFQIDITVDYLLLELENEGWGGRDGQYVYYFLSHSFVGTPEIGGEEASRMSEHNQYLPVWMDIDKLDSLDTLYPRSAAHHIAVLLREALDAGLKSTDT